MPPLFGPAGCCDHFAAEGLKHSWQAMSWLASLGLELFEYQAGHGLNAGDEALAKIGGEAKAHGIALSLHAPYFISMAAPDPDSRQKSLALIAKSLRAAHILGAGIIVVHPGGQGKLDRGQAMDLCRQMAAEAARICYDGGYDVKIGLETMGKGGQLGTLEEIVELCAVDPRIAPVVDFGHLHARTAGADYNTPGDFRRAFAYIADKLGTAAVETLHCHFSRIEYTNAGEKRHLTFADPGFGPNYETFIEAVAREGISPRIICESRGVQTADALRMKKHYQIMMRNSE